MSTTKLMIPEQIPDYALAPAVAREMNADALAGISTGFPPTIRIKGSKFRLVDGNGDETVLKAADLKDGEFLDLVVLAAKPGLNKTYYATAYDPNQAEAQALPPTCFSLDGGTPDASVTDPVNAVCATCPKNAFGSGRNQAGQPTKGKACSDNKILAVFHRGKVFGMKIPPASLKNFGLYVKQLTVRGVPLGNVVTYVGFDEQEDYAVLTFRVGAFIPDDVKAKLAAIAADQEVSEIIRPTALVVGPAPAAVEAAVAAEAKVESVLAETAVGAVEVPTAQKEAPPKRGKTKGSATETAETKKSPVMTDDEIKAALGL